MTIDSFYFKTLKKLLDQSKIDLNDSILVVCAGNTDKETFLSVGFKNVVISNLDFHGNVKSYAPYSWQLIDAEHMNVKDNSFDWVCVHAGLHHCASPHHALCEMLRVASKGVVVFEARDSFLMRLSIALNISSNYEVEPSILSKGRYGGWRNSAIPNFVYRWTEREVKKVASSFIPEFKHTYLFFYGLRVPTLRLSMSTNPLKKLVAKVASLIAPIFESLFPKQCNEFAFFISKQGPLQPWLVKEDELIKFNLPYFSKTHNPDNYLNKNTSANTALDRDSAV